MYLNLVLLGSLFGVLYAKEGQPGKSWTKETTQIVHAKLKELFKNPLTDEFDLQSK